MRLILEKNEIVDILSKHFEASFDPEDVIIRTAPQFEIELCGIPLGDAPKKEETNVIALPPRSPNVSIAPSGEKLQGKPRADKNASTDPPPPGNDGIEVDPAADVHPAAVLAASKALEKELDRENPQLKQRSGSYSYDPPGDFKKEIS